MIKFFTPILIALALIAGAFFLGKDYGKSKEVSNCQNQQIVNQDAETKSIIEAKKTINKISAMPDDAIWNELFRSNCTDCDK